MAQEVAGRETAMEVLEVSAHTELDEQSDAVQDWAWLNDADVDKVAKTANLDRTEAFWTLWRDVHRDLGYQCFVGNVAQNIDAAMLPDEAVSLGELDVRTHAVSARRYGGRALDNLDDWLQRCIGIGQVQTSLR